MQFPANGTDDKRLPWVRMNIGGGANLPLCDRRPTRGTTWCCCSPIIRVNEKPEQPMLQRVIAV